MPFPSRRSLCATGLRAVLLLFSLLMLWWLWRGLCAQISPPCVFLFFFSSVPWGRGETVLPCSGGGERRKTQESQLRLRSFLRASFSWGKEDCLSLSLSLCLLCSRGEGAGCLAHEPPPHGASPCFRECPCLSFCPESAKMPTCFVARVRFVCSTWRGTGRGGGS